MSRYMTLAEQLEAAALERRLAEQRKQQLDDQVQTEDLLTTFVADMETIDVPAEYDVIEPEELENLYEIATLARMIVFPQRKEMVVKATMLLRRVLEREDLRKALIDEAGMVVKK